MGVGTGAGGGKGCWKEEEGVAEVCGLCLHKSQKAHFPY